MELLLQLEVLLLLRLYAFIKKRILLPKGILSLRKMSLNSLNMDIYHKVKINLHKYTVSFIKRDKYCNLGIKKITDKFQVSGKIY